MWKSDTNSALTRGLKVLLDRNWDIEQAVTQSAAYRVQNIALGLNPGFVNTLVSDRREKREKKRRKKRISGQEGKEKNK